ncbi:MAG: 50S ribosomal protein L25 [Candidatus Pacebacteria bacterium]|nr:50S ribosomal protein L25 [Candidatus Paceibacterota bacterium]
MPKLKATERDLKKKPTFLREEGFVPAVYYGKKDKGTPVVVSKIDFKKIWKEVGETSTVELETPKGVVNVMIHDIQLDPVKSEVMHVDFYVVEKGQKVEVDVPLVFDDVAPAEKELGGVMVKVLYEISVEGEPQNVPNELTVNLAALIEMDSQILAKDIKLPKGVELKTDPEEVVVAMSEAVEEEEIPAEDVDMSAIEVEKKGKQDDEEKAEEASAE